MSNARFRNRMRASRQEEILGTALSLFGEQGCFGTKLDDICRLVGIAKGTIYLHFPSREALLRAALKIGVKRLHDLCWRAWRQAPTPAAGFRAVISELVSLSHTQPEVSPDALRRLQCGIRWSSPKRDIDHQVERALEPLAEAWRNASLIDGRHDPLWVARVILALTSAVHRPASPAGGATRTAAAAPLAPNASKADAMVDRIVATLRHGLAPPDRR